MFHRNAAFALLSSAAMLLAVPAFAQDKAEIYKLIPNSALSGVIDPEMADRSDIAKALPTEKRNPDDKLVIQLRYFDRLGWPEVAETLFGSREDFDDKYDSYMRRTLRIHGTALVELAEINSNERPGE